MTLTEAEARTIASEPSDPNCARRSLWGWSPPPMPANTRLERVVDRVMPRTGLEVAFFYGLVIALLVVAPHLPRRAELAADGLAALAAGSCVGPSTATDWGEEQPKISRRLLGRVFCYFLPYWRQAIVVLACIAAGAGIGLVPALVTKGLIDYLAHPRSGLEPLVLIVGTGVGAALLGGLIMMGQSYLTTSISEGIMYDLRDQLFGRLLKQSVGFFINSRNGDLLSRMDNDVAGVEDVISDTVFGLVTSAMVVTTTLVLMFSLSWQLTLATLLILPVFLYPSRRIGQLTYRARKQSGAGPAGGPGRA